MDAQTSRWTDIMALDNLSPDVLTSVTVGEQALVLLRDDDGVRAFAGKCPHKGAPLEQGVVCASAHGEKQVVCPWHKATFSAFSGRLIEPLALDYLDVYPVEIHDGRILVGSQPRAREEIVPMRDDETVILVGAGAASVTAAVTLRSEGFAGRILMISPEAELPYDRTALSKMVLGSEPDDVKIPPIRPEAWYQEKKIERVTASVTRVSLERHEVMLDTGETIRGDHLLLATGSRAETLKVPGVDLAGVHLLRTATDALAIVGDAGDHEAAIVIGSSFIAMEAAAALRKRGVGVTVVSRGDIPFQSKFGREIGLRMRELHESHGVAFVPDSVVARIGGNGKVEWVELDDGTRLNASMVVAGVGVGPVLEYLEPLPLNQENGGVDVDASMRLAPRVYAAGDIVSFPHGEKRYRIEHWRTAQAQARIAARAMLGLPVGDMPVPWFWTQQFDRKLEYVGWPGDFDAIDIEGNLDDFSFLARLRREGKTVGLVGAGRAKDIGRAVVDFDRV